VRTLRQIKYMPTWRAATRAQAPDRRPSLDDVLDRIERRRGGRVGFRQAVEDLTEERSRP
jgi:hypothetical protein